MVHAGSEGGWQVEVKHAGGRPRRAAGLPAVALRPAAPLPGLPGCTGQSCPGCQTCPGRRSPARGGLRRGAVQGRTEASAYVRVLGGWPSGVQGCAWGPGATRSTGLLGTLAFPLLCTHVAGLLRTLCPLTAVCSGGVHPRALHSFGAGVLLRRTLRLGCAAGKRGGGAARRRAWR